MIEIDGGTEIGYFIGYYAREGARAIGDAMYEYGKHMHETGSSGGAI